MRFISTNSSTAQVSLSEAIDKCMAPDGGMFMPASLPVIPRALFNNISEMSLKEIAFVAMNSLIGDDVPSEELKTIVDSAFAFDAPLRHLHDNIFVLELFHGPTLTFKDYGGRFMAQLMRYLDKKNSGTIRNILVATTGNTGAAAANGFYGMEGVNVSVLYPKGCLSRMQIAQFTSLGKNIHPLEVAGTVEDCKTLIQQALADKTMADLNLTGANSINVARLLPQIVFTMHAYARLREAGAGRAEQAVYAMPCGNLSNLVGAVMAKRMGLPSGKFIAATNANGQLSRLMSGATGIDLKQPPMRTLAPSIDMSYPSGWPRLRKLYNGNTDAMMADIMADAPVDDALIADTIKKLHDRMGYTIDPHGAVAYASALRNVSTDVPTVIFATGHPAKQLDIMTQITGRPLELPVQLTRFMAVRRHATIIPPTLPALRKHILSINKQSYGN